MRQAVIFLTVLKLLNTSKSISACEADIECSDGQWCSANSNGSKFCKPYASLGETCNAFTLPELMGVCDPTVHKCHEPKSCMLPDFGGTCVEKSVLMDDGDCCSSDADCASGECGELDDFDVMRKVCRSSSPTSQADVMENVSEEETATIECDQNNLCADGSFCTARSSGGTFCKAYSPLGGPCNAFTLPEFMELCNPAIHECYDPTFCMIADKGGTCVDKSFKKGDGDCCNANDECESGVCAQGLTDIGTMTNLCQASKVNQVNTNFDSELVDECDMDGDCSGDQWCMNRGSQNNICKPYLPTGGLCNIRSADPGRCNPETHFCYEPEWCRIADKGGSCMENSFKAQEGDCCSNDSDCASGSCGDKDGFSGSGICIGSVSRESETFCSSNLDCSDNSWCANNSDNTRSCRPYASLGEMCEGNVQGDFFNHCDQRIHKCYQPHSCKQNDLSGICVGEEMLFHDGDCCLEDSDCLSGDCSESFDEFGMMLRMCQPLVSGAGDNAVTSTPNGPCLVGDIMYSHGDSIGHLGTDCIDDFFYNGVESICQHGQILEVEKIFSCPDAVPVCNQCGVKAKGNALCLSKPTPTATTRSRTTCVTGSIWMSSEEALKSTGETLEEEEDEEVFVDGFNMDSSSSSGMSKSPLLVLSVGTFLLFHLS